MDSFQFIALYIGLTIVFSLLVIFVSLFCSWKAFEKQFATKGKKQRSSRIISNPIPQPQQQEHQPQQQTNIQTDVISTASNSQLNSVCHTPNLEVIVTRTDSKSGLDRQTKSSSSSSSSSKENEQRNESTPLRHTTDSLAYGYKYTEELDDERSIYDVPPSRMPSVNNNTAVTPDIVVSDERVLSNYSDSDPIYDTPRK